MSIKYKQIFVMVSAVLVTVLVALGFTRYFSGQTEELVEVKAEALIDQRLDTMLEDTVTLVDVFRTNREQQRLTAVRNYLRSAADNLLHQVKRYHESYPADEAWEKIRTTLLDVQIAETGYVFGMDSAGVLTIHPKSEGKDLSGAEHIDAMRSIKSGFITYHSVTAKRDKAVYYTYYEPLDLIIAPGVFIDELSALYDLEGEARTRAALNKRLEELRVGGEGYFWILQGSGPEAGRYIASPDGKKNGQNASGITSSHGQPVFRTMLEAALAAPGKIAHEQFAFKSALTGELEAMEMRFVYYEPFDWLIGTTVPVSEYAVTSSAIRQSFGQMEKSLLAVCGVLVLLAAGFAWWMAQRTVEPLRKVMGVITEVEKGHLDVRLNLARRDEIGEMARTIDDLVDNLQHEVVDPLQRLADGDLTFEAKPRDGRDVIRGALQKLSQDLNVMIGELQGTGDQIASGSGQVADSGQSLSQGATEQASSLEQISASMSQMASQTQHSAENATQASTLSNQAQQAAQKGQGQMQAMVQAMGEINTSSESISKIIKVIDEIAFQTNLLALNAAVEAARAGAHGKGFAVVAEEVRNLAGRSAKAAKETADLIEKAVHKTENGVEIAGQTDAALNEIAASITKTSDLVSEIAAASREQAEGIGQVNQGLSQIDQVTQQNTANAEESAAASEELSGQAERLRQLLQRFKRKDGMSVDPSRLSRPPKAAQNSAPSGEARDEFIALDDGEFGRY